MATRALIGYLDTDNGLKLTTTYNHYDGYPSNLGDGLKNFWNSDSRAEEIANVGYISFMNGEDGDWANTADGDTPSAKTITLPDDFNEAMMTIAEEIDSRGADYGYIWDNENEEWITITNNGIRRMSEDLERNLAHLKEKFSMMPERPDQTMEEGMSKDEEDVLGDWISDMLKYKSYDEVVKTVKRALRDALMDDELVAKVKADKKKKETPEIPGFEGTKAALDDLFEEEYFINRMKYRAGIIK